MSVDRIDRLLRNVGIIRMGGNRQRIYPQVGFTCSGNIHTWVFGALWLGQNTLFPELQIWRPTGDGVYVKVGYTTVMANQEISEFYEYSLPSPLAFQAGDVVGYYQPDLDQSQLTLLFELNGRDTQLRYINSSRASELNISSATEVDGLQLFLNVVTGRCG